MICELVKKKPESFIAPPISSNYAGEPRRVGVEIEFGQLTCLRAAEVVVDLFGGTISKSTDFRYAVENTRLGTFAVEMDFSLVHDADEKNIPPGDDVDDIAREIKEGAKQALGQVGEVIVPNEVTGPPIDLNDLPEMDHLLRALSDAGAIDTSENIIYGFGLQLNPEVVSTEAESVLRYLQSFMLLNDWLRSEIQVDLTRRLLPFADPFPNSYCARILSPDYAPTMTNLIDDYLEYNLTRNRDLDMLPFFTFLDEDRIKTALDDGLTKSRPTFHYRLPNCSLNDPAWSASLEWNRWVEVERLAEDPKRLREMADDWLAREWDGSVTAWVEKVRAWLT